MQAPQFNPEHQALPLNEALCIKFAAELIETVQNVKARRNTAPTLERSQSMDENVQYFFHSSGLRQFLQNAHTHFTCYIPLSLGQVYHQEKHAQAQVMFLENVRKQYEKWLSKQLSQHNKGMGEKVKIVWPAELINTNTAQVLNVIDPIEIDIDKQRECTTLLHSDVMMREEHISRFMVLGKQTCEHYQHLFDQTNTSHQKNVSVKLKLSDQPISWHELMKHFHDTDFILSLNHLERCFKFGVQKLFEKDSKSLPKDIRKKRDNGAYNSWRSDVKLNDLCYVASESVMVHLKIFPENTTPGEQHCNVMLYPGPLDLILGTIKNLLASQFNNLMSNGECVFLRAQRYNPQADTQDKNADLFLTQHKQASDYKKRRRQFIQESVGDRVPLEQAVLASKQKLLKNRRKARIEHKRKREYFNHGPYCQLLEKFTQLCEHQKQNIDILVAKECVKWDFKNPFSGVIYFYEQCSQLPNTDTYLNQLLKHFQKHLQQHSRDFNGTTSNTQKQDYIKRMACLLVECSANILETYGQIDAQHKKIKYEEQSTADIFLRAQDFLQAGLLFCLLRLTEHHLQIDELRDHRYYPEQPAVQYHTPPSTQTGSQSPSLSCRSLSRSGSFPLSRSNSGIGSQKMNGY